MIMTFVNFVIFKKPYVCKSLKLCMCRSYTDMLFQWPECYRIHGTAYRCTNN